MKLFFSCLTLFATSLSFELAAFAQTYLPEQRPGWCKNEP